MQKISLDELEHLLGRLQELQHDLLEPFLKLSIIESALLKQQQQLSNTLVSSFSSLA